MSKTRAVYVKYNNNVAAFIVSLVDPSVYDREGLVTLSSFTITLRVWARSNRKWNFAVGIVLSLPHAGWLYVDQFTTPNCAQLTKYWKLNVVKRYKSIMHINYHLNQQYIWHYKLLWLVWCAAGVCKPIQCNRKDTKAIKFQQ